MSVEMSGIDYHSADPYESSPSSSLSIKWMHLVMQAASLLAFTILKLNSHGKYMQL